MKFLFMHQNFPAQFVHMAGYLRKNPQHQVVFLTKREDGTMAGVNKVLYQPHRSPSEHVHHYIRNLEEAVIEGQAAAEAALRLKQQGFIPDVMIGHSGWGSTLFMKDIFPQTPLICLFEWFYRAYGADVDFDGNQVTPDTEARIRMKNAPILLDLANCDAGYSPTYWQHSQFPVEYANKLRVLHDGIDIEWCCPKPGAKLVLPHLSLDLSETEEIVTYVGRGMEPYRGFPQFMEAVSLLLKHRPRCHVVIVGQDKVFYGGQAGNGKTFKELMLERLELDMNRVHFTGHLPKNLYLEVLQASTVHVYLTKPFVLSWSMLEAMACGCTVVASNTKPVTEVINDGINGYLTEFSSPVAIAETVIEALSDRQKRQGISVRARQTIVERYDLGRLLPRQLAFIQEVIG